MFLGLAGLIIATDAPFVSVPLAFYVSILATTVICYVRAMELIKGLQVNIPGLLRVGRAKFAMIIAALPMLAIIVFVPMNTQIARYVLARFGTTREVAEYAVTIQFFSPLIGLISATGLSLWPIFAKGRKRDAFRTPDPLMLSAAFAAGAGIVALPVVALMPTLAALVSGSRLEVSAWQALPFALFVAAQAAHTPLAMFLTDRRGLRLQAIFLLVAFPVNLSLSLAFIDSAGAAAPVIGAGIALVGLQLLPEYLVVARRMRK